VLKSLKWVVATKGGKVPLQLAGCCLWD